MFTTILHASAVEVQIRRLDEGERKRMFNIAMLDGFHYDNSSEQVGDGPIDPRSK